MSNFDKHAYPGKCDVCGKETMVADRISTMGPVIFSYCKECLAARAEPYSFMVTFIAYVGEWPTEFTPNMRVRVRGLLDFHRKTEKEFSEDISAALGKMVN